MDRLSKYSDITVAFVSVSVIALYVLGIGTLLWNANSIFGRADSLFSPVLALMLFATSALFCAVVTLAYPVYVFWDQKSTVRSIKLVAYEVLFLVFYSFLLISMLTLFR